MPRAEVGSTKYLNNKLKSKGLQRLRWYCQVCERQMRDENGFKLHSQSESHVRQMLLVGEDPKKYINDYSSQFQRDFLQLLRTSHGEKQVELNYMYQEYISNKEHVHMNATKWPSLTEFAKFLGREGICRVEETDKGIQIAWIDNSPEALRRQDAIRKKERQDRGDEEREQRLIKEQIQRARADAEAREVSAELEGEGELKRAEGEKVVLNFGKKSLEPRLDQTPPVASGPGGRASSTEKSEGITPQPEFDKGEKTESPDDIDSDAKLLTQTGNFSLKMGIQSKPKNVFTAAKKNALASKKISIVEQPKKITEAERIMREELDRKRSRDAIGGDRFANKRQRF